MTQICTIIELFGHPRTLHSGSVGIAGHTHTERELGSRGGVADLRNTLSLLCDFAMAHAVSIAPLHAAVPTGPFLWATPSV